MRNFRPQLFLRVRGAVEEKFPPFPFIGHGQIITVSARASLVETPRPNFSRKHPSSIGNEDGRRFDRKDIQSGGS